jgi:hypothetical protein
MTAANDDHVIGHAQPLQDQTGSDNCFT